MTYVLENKEYTIADIVRQYIMGTYINKGKFFGFTPDEVKKLTEGEEVTADELKLWYDGYQIGKEPSLYNPFSVIRAIAHGECDSYWTATSTYDNVVTSWLSGIRQKSTRMLHSKQRGTHGDG